MEIAAAAAAGDVEAVARFLHGGGDPNAADKEGYTLMCEAASAGALDVVRLLLRHGARPADAGPDGSPLLLAVLEKRAEVAHCLLDWGAETGADVGVHAKNTGGSTALHCSMYGPGISVVRRLLEAGADPNTRCPGNWSPLTAAAASRDGLGFELEAAEALIDAGADLEPRTEPDGATALLHACYRGNYEIAALLLRRGADATATSADGFGTLGNVHRYPVELVRSLVGAGADPDRVTPVGWTPLLTACFKGRADVALELLRLGSSADGPPTAVRTPLWAAAHRKNGAILRMLIDAGAKIDARAHHPSTDWSFLAAAALEWLRGAEDELQRERAAHEATQGSFRFALPHLLARRGA
jgi:ankyrin repeat protein